MNMSLPSVFWGDQKMCPHLSQEVQFLWNPIRYFLHLRLEYWVLHLPHSLDRLHPHTRMSRVHPEHHWYNCLLFQVPRWGNMFSPVHRSGQEPRSIE